jgi:hypothetical protein
LVAVDRDLAFEIQRVAAAIDDPRRQGEVAMAPKRQCYGCAGPARTSRKSGLTIAKKEVRRILHFAPDAVLDAAEERWPREAAI